MRESGFDVSFRFGPFGGSTQDFAPVCLNSLLYKVERDLSELATDLRRPSESRHWSQLAEHRKRLINRYLWDSANGLFVDYNLRLHRRSNDLYATTFYPLWTGLATPPQARAVRRHLPQLEQPGGIAMSDRETGVQWDKPYGWAPIQLIAVEGLRRYGFNEDANRISYNFLTMVVENEKKDGTIREKYNVVNRTTVANVTAGYASNVVGFGWTNGTFLVLLHELSAREQHSILDDTSRTVSGRNNQSSDWARNPGQNGASSRYLSRDACRRRDLGSDLHRHRASVLRRNAFLRRGSFSAHARSVPCGRRLSPGG